MKFCGYETNPINIPEEGELLKFSKKLFNI